MLKRTVLLAAAAYLAIARWQKIQAADDVWKLISNQLAPAEPSDPGAPK